MTSTLSLLLISIASAQTAPQSVLLDFSADWCGPCQQMSPVVERLKRQGYPIRQVNVDREPQLSSRFGIRSIPAFVLVVNGREVDRVVGMCSESQLRRLLARIPQREPADDQAPDGRQSDNRTIEQSEESHGQSLPGADPSSLIPHPSSPDEPVIRANFDRRDSSAAAANRRRPTSRSFDPLDCSIRLRVRDDGGINYGSGTIIQSRPGNTVVLTCGHIFRSLTGDSTVEADVFHGGRFERFVGKVLGYDLDADVGLLSIPTDSPLPVSEVAGIDEAVSPGDHVFSVGCSGGEPPTKLQLRVTALNRYLGPDNVECTGVPIQGRSGGGLFNTDGQIVGVCIAADPKEKRGLYAGLKAVHHILDRVGLDALSRDPQEPNRLEQAPVIADGDAAPSPNLSLAEQGLAKQDHEFGAPPFPERSSDPALGKFPEPLTRGELIPVLSETSAAIAHGAAGVSPMPNDVNASADNSPMPRPADFDIDQTDRVQLDTAQRDTLQTALEQAQQAEVICIIRPVNDPQAASRVVIINRASAKFLAYLTGEISDQPQITTTVKRLDPADLGHGIGSAKGAWGLTSFDPSQTQGQLTNDDAQPDRLTVRDHVLQPAAFTQTSMPSETLPVTTPHRYRRSDGSR